MLIFVYLGKEIYYNIEIIIKIRFFSLKKMIETFILRDTSVFLNLRKENLPCIF